MMHRMNQRPNFTLLVVLACVAIASSTGLQTSSSAPVVLRGTDVGKFTVAPTSDPHVVVASDQAAGELTSVGRFTLNTGEHINQQTLEVTQRHFAITSTTGDKLIGTYKGTAH